MTGTPGAAGAPWATAGEPDVGHVVGEQPLVGQPGRLSGPFPPPAAVVRAGGGSGSRFAVATGVGRSSGFGVPRAVVVTGTRGVVTTDALAGIVVTSAVGVSAGAAPQALTRTARSGPPAISHDDRVVPCTRIGSVRESEAR